MINIKSIIKKIISTIPIATYRKALPFSIIRESFATIIDADIYANRELLWENVLGLSIGDTKKIIFIEFGVYEGYSIDFFSKKNKNINSVFIGLDSFEGLPERWREMSKATFTTSGKIPHSNDTRVSFIKGWFHNSWM